MLSALFIWKMSSHAKTKKWTDLGISNFSGKKWPQACQNDLSFFFLTPKQTCIFCETKLRQSARVSNQILVFAFVSGFLVPIRPFFSHRAYALFILHLGSATIRNTDNDWQCQQIEPHKQLLPRLLCTPANKKKLCWHYWSAGVKWKKKKKKKREMHKSNYPTVVWFIFVFGSAALSQYISVWMMYKWLTALFSMFHHGAQLLKEPQRQPFTTTRTNLNMLFESRPE